MIIQEPMEDLIARADKFVINREVLDRLQETFASEILSIALIRSQLLLNEREQQAALLAAAAQGASSPGTQGNSSPVRPALGNSLSSHFASLTNSLASTGSSSSSKKGAGEDSGAQGSAQTSVDSAATDSNSSISVNTGLASLSLAERRKIIQV